MHNHLMTINRQAGAVLLISMIMLLLLSLIGATGMQVSALEEKMAGNSRDSNLAFQNAETTLRGAERLLKNNPVPVFNNTLGNYQYDSTKEPWNTVDWASNTDTRTYTLTLGGVNALSPRFIIEELPAVPDPGGPIDLDPLENKYYRITTRAFGATDSSVVMLQSVYKKK